MDVVASMYPALSERRNLPVYYTPCCLGLSMVPFLVKNQGLTSFFTWPLLLYLCASWPCFTTGDPSTDYYNNSHFIAIPLWYIDFVLLTPRDGKDAPAFTGRKLADNELRDDASVVAAHGQSWKDLETFSERVKWSTRLMLPAQRGIGWNWQVKNVPEDPYARLPRWQYVWCQLRWAVLYYVQSVAVLTILGMGCVLKAEPVSDELFMAVVADAVVGWSGAVWVWDRLNCAYLLAAALGVATGVTEPWEWPPLMGPLKDAWSVRQMWRYVHCSLHIDFQKCADIQLRSATYHQACRRVSRFQGLRLARRSC
jgi:hypothetical protein